MVRVTGAWSIDEAADFLGGTRVPLRLACRTPPGRLWMLSLWFRYEDGAFLCATSADADVVGYLREDPGVAFEVSTNDPPYKGVRGSGRASIEPDGGKELLRSLIERYLGGTDSELAGMLLSDGREEVSIRIDPDRLYTWDFTDRMRGVS